jgi:hypothetical protein
MPNLLAVHDEFLVACVRSSTSKLPVSRLRLVRNLHQETRRDLRFCMAVVNNFCDRHEILMPHTGLKVWLPLLFTGLCLAIALAMNITGQLLGRSAVTAITHSQRSALMSERVHLDFVFLAAFFVSAGLALIALWLRQKKAKVDAAEAIAKFTR